MLKMRLQRRGKKNYATFRVVVAEHTAPVKGKYVADLGWYNPHTDEMHVDGEAATAWLSKGAQASPTVHNLLIENGYLKAEKVTSWRKKKKEAEEGEADASSTAEKEATAEASGAPAPEAEATDANEDTTESDEKKA